MRIAFSTLAASGHLNPMLTLAHAVRERGHDVFFCGVMDCAAPVSAAGFEFRGFAAEEFPTGSRRQMEARLSTLHGIAGLRYTLDRMIALFRAELREGPRLLREAGAEAVVIDEVPGGLTPAARELGLPLVHVANALPIQIDHRVPPPFVDWAYGEGWVALARNRAAWAAFHLALRPFFQAAKAYPREPDARVAQLPAAFDFPVTADFHRTGPFHDARRRTPVPFPWDQLTGAPLIYASLGTVQNGAAHVFRAIAAACSGTGCQLVMSLGENVSAEEVGASNCILVSHAPQLELLQRSVLCVTHAGLNTALESLAAGVPMVAIPITNDQPGVAARISYTGTGVAVPFRGLNEGRVCSAILTVLRDRRYRERTVRMQREFRAANGLERAAEIIDGVVTRS